MVSFYSYSSLMICVFLFLFYASNFCAGNKYSENVNKKMNENLESDEPFRMKKVNLLWIKAKKVLSGQKLADLYADLKIHDGEEGRLKKLRAGNADKDGAKEAQVLASYKDIVERYGLGIFRSDLDNEIPMTNDEVKSVYFQDSKLRSMWKRAELSGFSDEDLQKLKEEFWHQQMKLNEYDFMRRELNAKDEDLDENSIDKEEMKNLLPPEEQKEKMLDLKKQNKEVQEGYMRLEHKASTLLKDGLDFNDYRVQKLWSLAKKTNWSELQMDSFKEELKHFEHRLSKQDYYEEQLELTKEHFKDKVREGDEYPEKLKDMKEKTEQVKEKVKKLHFHMKTKLEKALRHSEL